MPWGVPARGGSLSNTSWWPRCCAAARYTATRRSASPAQAYRAVTRSYPDRKSTRLNSSHDQISYAVFCLKKKKNRARTDPDLDSRLQQIVNLVTGLIKAQHCCG